MSMDSIRTLTININKRCPLSCAHCSVGFSDTYRGDAWKMGAEELRGVIAAVDPEVYGLVLFAGGEPSLNPELVRAGVEACRARGVRSAVVTAPVWARDFDTASRFTRLTEGLDVVILSYDRFHLEFLTFEHYRVAAAVSMAAGRTVVFQVAYESERERERMTASLESIRGGAHVNSMRVVAVGNAAAKRTAKGVLMRTARDLERLPRACLLGNSFVDESLAVHGCCWASAGEESPFTSRAGAGGPAATFRRLEESPVFQAVRASGFIGSLGPRGLKRLADAFRGRRFSSECDLCVAAMTPDMRDLWLECGTEAAA